MCLSRGKSSVTRFDRAIVASGIQSSEPREEFDYSFRKLSSNIRAYPQHNATVTAQRRKYEPLAVPLIRIWRSRQSSKYARRSFHWGSMFFDYSRVATPHRSPCTPVNRHISYPPLPLSTLLLILLTVAGLDVQFFFSLSRVDSVSLLFSRSLCHRKSLFVHKFCTDGNANTCNALCPRVHTDRIVYPVISIYTKLYLFAISSLSFPRNFAPLIPSILFFFATAIYLILTFRRLGFRYCLIRHRSKNGFSSGFWRNGFFCRSKMRFSNRWYGIPRVFWLIRARCQVINYVLSSGALHNTLLMTHKSLIFLTEVLHYFRRVLILTLLSLPSWPICNFFEQWLLLTLLNFISSAYESFCSVFFFSLAFQFN